MSLIIASKVRQDNKSLLRNSQLIYLQNGHLLFKCNKRCIIGIIKKTGFWSISLRRTSLKSHPIMSQMVQVSPRTTPPTIDHTKLQLVPPTGSVTGSVKTESGSIDHPLFHFSILTSLSLNGILGYNARMSSKVPSEVTKMTVRLLPTGKCWCGCGHDVARGSFFLPGHDKKAEAAVILVEYGGVPEFLTKHGFGPGGKNPQKALEEWHLKNNSTRR
jgi:hypothetical protein